MARRRHNKGFRLFELNAQAAVALRKVQGLIIEAEHREEAVLKGSYWKTRRGEQEARARAAEYYGRGLKGLEEGHKARKAYEKARKEEERAKARLKEAEMATYVAEEAVLEAEQDLYKKEEAHRHQRPRHRRYKAKLARYWKALAKLHQARERWSQAAEVWHKANQRADMVWNRMANVFARNGVFGHTHDVVWTMAIEHTRDAWLLKGEFAQSQTLAA